MTSVAHLSMYSTHLAATKESLSSHVTTKCVPKSYTSLDEPYSQQIHTAKASSTRAAEYQRGRYVKVLIDWRHRVTYSSEYYGTDLMTPSSTSK